MDSAPSMDALFERRLVYPDFDAKDRLDRLVGLDDQKLRLSKILGILVNSSGFESWAKKHHPQADVRARSLLNRPPLVILSGDVGCGKTELAETIGDSIARQEKIDLTLFPLSLSTRGQGRVGEMTQLLSSAFDYVVQEAGRLKGSSGKSRGGIILLIDEADAIAQSREAAQMHHEDKAGVNAFIRGVDRLTNGKLPAAVIMCTNRLKALDPAVKRRAADILIFERPTEDQRRNMLKSALEGMGFSDDHIETLVSLTGEQPKRNYGFAFSDIRQRLIPAIILDAYPEKAIDAKRAIEVAKTIVPTPPFQDN